jgi:hypothetical protein
MKSSDSKITKYIPSWIHSKYGSVFSLIFLCIILVISILELVFGLIFANQCPIDNRIPLYLVVSGTCGIGNVIMIFNFVRLLFCIF